MDSAISGTYRIFIALELPSDLQVALKTELHQLQRAMGVHDVRWVAPESIHITLKFLGDVPARQMDAIKRATQQASERAAAFSLVVESLGCFPNPKHPKVIWVGVRGDVEELQGLRNRVEAQVAPLGYPTEDRPFHPHLTLGRVKGNHARVGGALQNCRVGRIGTWRCEQVSIMQSTLTPDGAIYRPLAHFSLSEPA